MTLEQLQERLAAIRVEVLDLMDALPRFAEGALRNLKAADSLLASADEDWPDGYEES